MRRLFYLLIADMRFQFTYGFYYLYLGISLLYIMLLGFIPQSWLPVMRIVLVFSDPAALGLFFIGAILLYEKGERVLSSLSVSPVRPVEYLAGKLLSLAGISTLSGMAIYLLSGGLMHGYFIPSLLLCSCLFTAAGFCVAVRIKTINQFIVYSIPLELILFFPAFLSMSGVDWPLLSLHPGVAAIALMTVGSSGPLHLAVLSVWTFAILLCALWHAHRLCSSTEASA